MKLVQNGQHKLVFPHVNYIKFQWFSSANVVEITSYLNSKTITIIIIIIVLLLFLLNRSQQTEA